MVRHGVVAERQSVGLKMWSTDRVDAEKENEA